MRHCCMSRRARRPCRCSGWPACPTDGPSSSCSRSCGATAIAWSSTSRASRPGADMSERARPPDHGSHATGGWRRRDFLLASGATLGAAAWLPSPAVAGARSQATAATTPPRFLPMAVWYGGGRARAPMLERDARSKKDAWAADVRQIRALGFNTLRGWIDWASGEPEQGQYQFDTLDVLLELAEDHGLRMVLQVYMDSAPRWVGERFPDSLFVSSGGQVIEPESSPGYCRDHAGVRAA